MSYARRDQRPAVALVRSGAFSGSALSLLQALREQVPGDVLDVDLYAVSRSLTDVLLEGLSLAEAKASGSIRAKTSSWSRAKSVALKRAVRPGTPVIFVQTLAAPSWPSAPYVVYTDRVGLEAADSNNPLASRGSPRWHAREKAFLLRAEKVLVMGTSTAEVLRTRYGLESQRVQVVGAAPNTALPPWRKQPHEGPPRSLLFVGTQFQLKGGRELLEAFSLVRESMPELTLTIVGSEPEGRVPPNVRVLGRLPATRMGEQYERADALVLPTRYEAYGIAFVEALMCGLPVLGTRVGNIPHIVGDCGVLVEPSSSASLADGLHRLVANYDEFARRAHSRGLRLRAELSWTSIGRAALDGVGVLAHAR